MCDQKTLQSFSFSFLKTNGFTQKTSILLLPEVICNIIILCSIPIYMLAVVFDEKRDKEDVEHLNHGQSLGRGPAIIVLILSEGLYTMNFIPFFVWWPNLLPVFQEQTPFLLCIPALMWHKTAVTYSLFKMMQENENENKPSVDADVRVRSNLAPPDPGSSA